MSPRYRAAVAAILALPLFASAAPANAATKPTPRQTHYVGTIDFVGHYRKPNDTRRFQSEQYFYTDGKGRVRLDWYIWSEGDSVRVPKSSLILGNEYFYRRTPDSKWQLRTGDRARGGRFEALAGLRTENLIEKHAHPRLGDVRDSVIVDSTTLLVSFHERDGEWRVNARLFDSNNEMPSESLFTLPTSPLPPDPSDVPLTAVPVIVQLAPGVFCADMDDIDSRCLVVEFADHLAVAEIAVGSENGERIIAACKKRWPAKPIRYASFSHHHPHYLGGIRAMIAEGATIVTTTGNEAYMREIAARPFTMEPDRLARSPKPVSVKAFTGRTELADSTNRLVLLDYGARSNHTDEFVVFYLPRQKFLFESELGWVRRDDGTLRPSSRAAALLEWMRQEKLDVERMAQGWPMRGNEREVTRAWLEGEVAKASKKP